MGPRPIVVEAKHFVLVMVYFRLTLVENFAKNKKSKESCRLILFTGKVTFNIKNSHQVNRHSAKNCAM